MPGLLGYFNVGLPWSIKRLHVNNEVVTKKKPTSCKTVHLPLCISERRGSGMVAPWMCSVGGDRASGTLGGGETIVALQLLVPAVEREPGKCSMFSVACHGWLAADSELIWNDNARVAVVIVVLSVSQEEVCLPLACSKIDGMVW